MRYGQTDILIDSVKIEETKETGFATISYTQAGSIEAVRENTPPYNSRSQLIPAAYRLTKKSIETTGTGSACKVTLTYEIAENEDSSSDGFTHGEEKEGTVLEQTTTVKNSILLHPKFAEVPEDEKIFAKAMLDGVVPYDTVFIRKSAAADSSSDSSTAADAQKPLLRTSVTKKESAHYDETTFKCAVDKHVKTDGGKLLLKKILAGVTDYNTSYRKRTHTDYSTRPGTDAVNVICYPPGVKSGSWMRTLQTSNFDAESGTYTITTVYEEADGGATWDSDIYDSEIKQPDGHLK